MPHERGCWKEGRSACLGVSFMRFKMKMGTEWTTTTRSNRKRTKEQQDKTIDGSRSKKDDGEPQHWTPRFRNAFCRERKYRRNGANGQMQQSNLTLNQRLTLADALARIGWPDDPKRP